MIVLETDLHYLMIKQHDHANLSRQFAEHWRQEAFLEIERFADVLEGINEHDRSWIVLDDTPFYHTATDAPYSFIDFPLKLKLHFYSYGLNELEKINEYGCLLASLHYCSFFKDSKDHSIQIFLQEEKERQIRLRQSCQILGAKKEEALLFHFKLLQLCDDLSLYVCLNRPGTPKEKEHPWFRQGFAYSEIFDPEKKKPIIAKWLNKTELTFSSFPFKEQFTIHLKYKAVQKNDIKQRGLELAYKEAKTETETYIIRHKGGSENEFE